MLLFFFQIQQAIVELAELGLVFNLQSLDLQIHVFRVRFNFFGLALFSIRAVLLETLDPEREVSLREISGRLRFQHKD